jgi:hypothetical protein
MAHELLWFHTELARTLGSALKDLVAAQGAAAGQALHACQGHFAPLRAMLRDPPAAFRGALGERALGGGGPGVTVGGAAGV